MHLSLSWIVMSFLLASGEEAAPGRTVFRIGQPDGSCLEFGGSREGANKLREVFPRPVVFTAGESPPGAWPFIQPSRLDQWGGNRDYTYTVRFRIEDPSRRYWLRLFFGDTHESVPPRLHIGLNGREVSVLDVPRGLGQQVFEAFRTGTPWAPSIPLPPGGLEAGMNELTLRSTDGSWITYDCLILEALDPPPLAPAAEMAYAAQQK